MSKLESSLVGRTLVSIPKMNKEGELPWNHTRDDLPEGEYRIHTIAPGSEGVWFYAEPITDNCNAKQLNDWVGCIGMLYALIKEEPNGATDS